MKHGTLLLIFILLLPFGIAEPWQHERTCKDTWTTTEQGHCDSFSEENDGGENRITFDNCNLAQTRSDLKVKNPEVSTPIIQPGENLSTTCQFKLQNRAGDQEDGESNKLFLFYHNGEKWKHRENFTDTGVGAGKDAKFTRNITVENSGEQWVRCAITQEIDDLDESGSVVEDYCATNYTDYDPYHDNDDTNFYVDAQPPQYPTEPATGEETVNLGQRNTVSFAVEDNSAPWLQNNKKYNGCPGTDDICSLDDNGLRSVVINVKTPSGNVITEKEVSSSLSMGAYTHTIEEGTLDSAGEWNVTVTATDLAGNTKQVFDTFHVSDKLGVVFTGTPGQIAYSKGATIPFAARDVNGNPYTADWTADINGPNAFSTTQTWSDSSSFSITVEQDWPVGAYTTTVTATKNGNTGTLDGFFNVTDEYALTLENEDAFRGQTFSPGAAFSVYPRVRLAFRGDDKPISQARVELTCLNEDLEPHTLILEEGDPGIYRKTGEKTCYAVGKYETSFSVSISATKDERKAGLQVNGLETRDRPGNVDEDFSTVPRVTVETPRSGARFFETQWETIPLNLTTDIDATCEYDTRPHQNWDYGSGTPFTQTGKRKHTTRYTPETYQQNTVFIKCWPEEQRPGTTGKQPRKTQAQFTYIPATDLNFTVLEKNTGIIAAQGVHTQVKLFAIRNQGNTELPLNLNVTQPPPCCAVTNLSDPVMNPIGVKSKRNIHAVITPSLNRSTGNYTMTVAASTGERTDEISLTITVTPSDTVTQFKTVKTRLENAENRVQRLRDAGTDPGNAATFLNEADTAAKQAAVARSRNQADAFTGNVTRATEALDDAERELVKLEFLTFLRENTAGILLLVFLVNALGITELYIIYPFLVLRDRLQKLRAEEDDLLAERESIEQQYFTRALEKSTFEEMVTRKQEELNDVRSEIKELEELLEPRHIVEHPKALHNHVKTLDAEPSFTKRLLQQLAVIKSWVTGHAEETRRDEEEKPVEPRDVDETVEKEAAASPGEDVLSLEEKKDVLVDVLEDAEPVINQVEDRQDRRRFTLQMEALQKSVERTEDEEKLDELAAEIKNFIERIQSTRDNQ